MSFFIRPKNSIKQNVKLLQKNKKSEKRKVLGSTSKAKKKKGNVEDIESEDEEDNEEQEQRMDKGYESEEDNETAQEKKVRLAKLYLEEITRKEQRMKENGEVDKDDITNYLKEDLREKSSKSRKTVAESYIGYDEANVLALSCKQHHLPLTCVVVSFDNKYIFSGSKDSGIVKWSLEDGKKLMAVKDRCIKGQKKPLGIVLCLALSSDGQFLASGSSKAELHVWNPATMEHLHAFGGHKGAVTGVVFQRNHHTLFSASADRSVKVWNLAEMAYVESLFGHQKGITAIDALLAERALTAGEDNSVHLWKIVEESQLIYNANSGVDCVKLINEEYFLSGGSDGTLCMWGVLKKRPLCTVARPHGVDPSNEQANWITSVAALVNTDLVASGSCDGVIRLWHCQDHFKKLVPLFEVQAKGFVNGLHFTSDGKFLVAAVGAEHRLGRWWRLKDAKNRVLVIPLCKK